MPWQQTEAAMAGAQQAARFYTETRTATSRWFDDTARHDHSIETSTT